MLLHSPTELALNVIKHRKKLKLSQAEVGKMVGLKQSTISAFENNPGGTKLDTLFHILSAVNLDIRVSSKNESPKNKWKYEW